MLLPPQVPVKADVIAGAATDLVDLDGEATVADRAARDGEDWCTWCGIQLARDSACDSKKRQYYTVKSVSTHGAHVMMAVTGGDMIAY